MPDLYSTPEGSDTPENQPQDSLQSSTQVPPKPAPPPHPDSAPAPESELPKSELKDQKTASEENLRPPVQQEKVLFSWKGPSRPFKQRSRDFWVTIVGIVTVVGIILFLLEGVMPVVLLIALTFLYYILNTVNPDNIHYAITNQGIKIADRITPYQAMFRFYFINRGATMLVVETASLGGRLEFVVDEKDVDKIRKHLGKYVIEEKLPPNTTDRLTNWVSQKLPS